MNPGWLALTAIVIAILILIFVPVIRAILSRIIYAAIVIAACIFIVLGLSMFTNNVALYESPGVGPRIARFLSTDFAATSKEGLGSATCQPTPAPMPSATASRPPEERSSRRRRRARGQSRGAVASAAAGGGVRAAGAPATPAPAASATPSEVYPELVERSYPGIAPARLFKLATEAVNSMPRWKIVNSDPRTRTLQCTYTGDPLAFVDNVTIVVKRDSAVHVCSQSAANLPGLQSWLRFFPGDFGANIGHIKQFYSVLEPATEKVYQAIEMQQNRRAHH